MEELHFWECTKKHSAAGAWCGNGTYNDMRSYIRSPQLIQVVPANNYILERGSRGTRR